MVEDTWISMDDAVPPDETVVLVAFPDEWGDYWNYRLAWYYRGNAGGSFLGFREQESVYDELHNVTHWRTLPGEPHEPLSSWDPSDIDRSLREYARSLRVAKMYDPEWREKAIRSVAETVRHLYGLIQDPPGVRPACCLEEYEQIRPRELQILSDAEDSIRSIAGAGEE